MCDSCLFPSRLYLALLALCSRCNCYVVWPTDVLDACLLVASPPHSPWSSLQLTILSLTFTLPTRQSRGDGRRHDSVRWPWMWPVLSAHVVDGSVLASYTRSLGGRVLEL